MSYDTDGHERHIEVKTAALGAEAPFYISLAELEFARRHLASYALYRVYAVLLDPPQFFVPEGRKALDLELTPVAYRACLPAEIPAEETDD